MSPRRRRHTDPPRPLKLPKNLSALEGVAEWVIAAVDQYDRRSGGRDSVAGTARLLGLGVGQVRAARTILAARGARREGAPDDG